MKFKDKKIKNLNELLIAVTEDSKKVKGPIWFRGHRSKNWFLQPYILRNKSKKKEIDFLREFKQHASLLVDKRPQSLYEWLFIMRHYEIPSRLLDWTESPLVAAYFATNSMKPKGDGTIWGFSPLEFNQKIEEVVDSLSLPSFEENEDLMKPYRPEEYEKLENEAPSPTIAFLAPRNTTRMQVQLSVFTIHHRNETPIEQLERGKNNVWRYIISPSAKKTISKELELLKIDRFQLYPELEKIKYKIMRKNFD